MKKVKFIDQELADHLDLQYIHDFTESEINDTATRCLFGQDGVVTPLGFDVEQDAPVSGYVVIPAHTGIQSGAMIDIGTDLKVAVLNVPDLIGQIGAGKVAPPPGKSRITSIYVRYGKVNTTSQVKDFVDDSTDPPTIVPQAVLAYSEDSYDVRVVHGSDAVVPVPPPDQAGWVRYANVTVAASVVVITDANIDTSFLRVYGLPSEVIALHTHDGALTPGGVQISYANLDGKPDSFTPQPHNINKTPAGLHEGSLDAETHGSIAGTNLHPVTVFASTDQISNEQHSNQAGGTAHELVETSTTLMTEEEKILRRGFMSAADKIKLETINPEDIILSSHVLLAGRSDAGETVSDNVTILGPDTAILNGLMVYGEGKFFLQSGFVPGTAGTDWKLNLGLLITDSTGLIEYVRDDEYVQFRVYIPVATGGSFSYNPTTTKNRMKKYDFSSFSGYVAGNELIVSLTFSSDITGPTPAIARCDRIKMFVKGLLA